MRRRAQAAERGSVLFVVMIVLAALMAGGAVALYIQLGNTRGSGLSRFARASLYCAEAGLNATRQTIVNNYATWNDILDPNATSPSWYGEGIEGEAGDDDDNDDWVVTIYDNDDEFPTPNPARDNDLRIFVKSECRMFSDQPRSVVELVRYDTMPSDYEGKCKGAQCANDMTP